MLSIPAEAQAVLGPRAGALTAPPFRRRALLARAALLTTGRRTARNLLRATRGLAHGDDPSSHRVLSSAPFRGLRRAALFARRVLPRLRPGRRVERAGADTVRAHQGKKAFGRGRHRDPVRGRHACTAWRGGHRWVVLAVRARFPFATRPGPVPVLVALYRARKDNEAAGRRPKTPAERMRRMRCVRSRWFPRHAFGFAGDQGHGTHGLAPFAPRRPGRLALVSRSHADAGPYEPPPPYAGAGRPRGKGDQRPAPRGAVAASGRPRRRVAWYGGGRRRVGVVSAVAHGYKAGVGLVAPRWAYAHDRTGTHRDDYLYSTDGAMTAKPVIEAHTRRRDIETMFPGMRAPLGPETTRGRCRSTVRRGGPCRLGLYGACALLYEGRPEGARACGRVVWAGKAGVTFADAISAARGWRG
jgi:hypothetical protein